MSWEKFLFKKRIYVIEGNFSLKFSQDNWHFIIWDDPLINNTFAFNQDRFSVVW